MPVLRSDNGKVALTLKQVTNHLLELNTDIVDNRNTVDWVLGTKRLHLNATGLSLSANNLVTLITRFSEWSVARHS